TTRVCAASSAMPRVAPGIRRRRRSTWYSRGTTSTSPPATRSGCGPGSRSTSTDASFARIGRLALLRERPHAFAGVPGPEDGAPDLQLLSERIGFGNALVALGKHLHQSADRERPVLADGGGDAVRFGERLSPGGEPADEAEGQRLARCHVAAGEQDLGRERVRDLAAQANARAAEREKPAARPGDPEGGVL